MSALAYRILDTGAEGGIIVSPLGLQEGARKVAEAEDIIEVRLSPDSTLKKYLMRFLNKVMAGTHMSTNLGIDMSATVVRADKNEDNQ